jgi:23S rRNA (pseudouridine1915-N3)-methyltransferase
MWVGKIVKTAKHRQKSMLRILIRAIGALPSGWHQQAIHSYLTQLRPYAAAEIVELPEGHKKSAKPNVERAVTAEGRSLLKGIPQDAFVIALDERGKSMDSVGFTRKIVEWSAGGRPLVFLLGGSWGLSDEVRVRADVLLSFGPMTFPHALARVMLLEQLYRAAMIRSGKAYHK